MTKLIQSNGKNFCKVKKINSMKNIPIVLAYNRTLPNIPKVKKKKKKKLTHSPTIAHYDT